MLLYASKVSLLGCVPGMGRGRASTTERMAIAGMELSTEFSSLSAVSFSIRGPIKLGASFLTSGPRLQTVSNERSVWWGQGEPGAASRRSVNVPFDSLVLDLAVLIV